MKFLDIRIECLEDIKVTSALNQVNTNETLSYISGSAIRGAFINNYIRMFNVSDISKEAESKSWFFDNGLEFLNGYIEADGDRTYPIPQGLYCDAVKVDEYYSNMEIEVKNGLIHKISETDKKFSPSEFVRLGNFSAKGVGVNKLFNLHIRKDKEKKMFRYEAIEKGQVFRALIKSTLNDEELEKVIKILEEGDFYIGGSKGSGYGKVRLKVLDTLGENPESIDINNDIKDEFVVFTTSDGIFVDEFGNTISYIDEKWLESELELENVRLAAAMSEEILVGGYNKKWGVRIPQHIALKKGSVLKYIFDKGTITKEKLNKIQLKGYGLRTEEGYGRFIIMPNLTINVISKYIDSKGKEKLGRIKYTDEEKEQLQFIVNSVARRKLDYKMKEIIVSNYSTDGKVNNNQIGKLVQLFSLAQKQSKEEGIKNIKNYIEHLEINNKSKDGIKKERINQNALNQLKDLRIHNKRVIDFILTELEEIKLDKFIKEYSINSIKIDGIKPKFTEQEAYIYKMIELENTFRYILRNR